MDPARTVGRRRPTADERNAARRQPSRRSPVAVEDLSDQVHGVRVMIHRQPRTSGTGVAGVAQDLAVHFGRRATAAGFVGCEQLPRVWHAVAAGAETPSAHGVPSFGAGASCGPSRSNLIASSSVTTRCLTLLRTGRCQGRQFGLPGLRVGVAEQQRDGSSRQDRVGQVRSAKTTMLSM